MSDGFEDPQKRRKATTALLWATPVMFAFGYAFVYLTEFKPTPRLGLIIGSVSAGLTLFFAASLALFGRDWMSGLRIVAIVAAVITVLVRACSS